MSEWMVFRRTRITQPLPLASVDLGEDHSQRITHFFVFFDVSP